MSHGANLFKLCPLPDSSALYVQNWFPIGPAVWPNFPVFWIVDPIKPPKMPPWGIVGRIVFSLCPFPDESTEVYQIWCKSVQPFDSFPRLLNVWPPNPPPPPPTRPLGVLRGDLYLAYTHSQMNLQMWTKVGANRSSHLKVFPGLSLFDPLKLPKCPPCVSRGNLFGVYPFPNESTKLIGANRTSRLNLPLIFEFVTPTPPPPPNVEGRIVFSLCPFPDESANVYQIWCQSVIGPAVWQPPRLFDLWPPKPPEMPLVSWCSLCLAYSHC